MDKSKLIVLSERTSRGWGEDAKDALIYNLANSELIVASNFDAATMSWSSGRYFADANAAIAHFHGNPDPRWSIPGCTPDDVLGLYGEEHGLSIDDARGIADRVNAALGADDDLFRDELHRQVTGYRAATRHAQETVAGTMTLDCNGYDYLLCADSRSAPTEHAGRAASEEAFAVIRYSTSMIEEAMAKEGIPLTQPNIASVRERLAKALIEDARENAPIALREALAYAKPTLLRDAAAGFAAKASAEDREHAHVASLRAR
ncbi:hypothetical protein [Rubneribacter sp.]|nr:hypothetical protein [Candidatus Rubneribacter avistercoris]